MSMMLSGEQVAEFERSGVLFPLDAIGASEATILRRRLETLEEQEGGRLSKKTNHKSYLLIRQLADLVRDPRILDRVESLIGPNILCWATDFFIKDPNDQKRVTWHQDSTYWGLSSPDVVTAWVALTHSTIESGCMRVIPGSHIKDQLPHRDTHAPDNLLTRGQEVEVQVDERQATNVVLHQGQMSIHHVRLIHGSERNRSEDRRIGFAIRYVPTYVRQTSEIRDSAMLVRGTDEFGHFQMEMPPLSDFHPDAVAQHARAAENQLAILYASAKRRPIELDAISNS